MCDTHDHDEHHPPHTEGHQPSHCGHCDGHHAPDLSGLDASDRPGHQDRDLPTGPALGPPTPAGTTPPRGTA